MLPPKMSANTKVRFIKVQSFTRNSEMLASLMPEIYCALFAFSDICHSYNISIYFFFCFYHFYAMSFYRASSPHTIICVIFIEIYLYFQLENERALRCISDCNPPESQ